MSTKQFKAGYDALGNKLKFDCPYGKRAMRRNQKAMDWARKAHR